MQHYGPGLVLALWLELQTSGPAPASQAVALGPKLVLASCVVASGLGPGPVQVSLAGAVALIPRVSAGHSGPMASASLSGCVFKPQGHSWLLWQHL